MYRWLLAFVFLAAGIGAWFFPFLGFFIPVCMVGGIITGFFRGRIWCGRFCPRGAFYDTLMKPLSPKKTIPSFFKSPAFRVLVLVLLMSFMVFQLVRLWPNPEKIGRLFAVLLTATTALGVVLAMVFHQRMWCAFCPVGSLAYWAGRRNAPKRTNREGQYNNGG